MAEPARDATPSPFSFSIPSKLKGLYLVLFVEIFGASLTIPVFVYFCIEELGLSATYVGILMSSFNAAQLIGAPIIGRISDGHGRRPALLFCFLWTALCFFGTAFVRTFFELVIVRTCAGLSGGSIPVTQAMIVDAAPPDDRARTLGILGAILGIAFTLGPSTMVVIFLFAPDVERRNVFIAAAIFALIGFLIGLWVLHETLPENKRRPLCGAAGSDSSTEQPSASASVEEGSGAGASASSTCDLNAGSRDCQEVANKGLVLIWITRFFAAFAMLCLFATYAFLIKDAFKWGDAEFGAILALSGLLGAGIQGLLFPTLSAKLGRHNVCVLGLLLVAAFFIALPWCTLEAKSIWLHLATLALFGIGSSLVDPGLPDLVGVYAPDSHMGFAQGVANSFKSVAAVVAPLGAGALYDYNPYYLFLAAAGSSFLGALCVLLASMIGTTINTGAKKQMDLDEYTPLMSRQVS